MCEDTRPETADMVVRGVASILTVMCAAHGAGELDDAHLGDALWLLSECLLWAEGER